MTALVQYSAASNLRRLLSVRAILFAALIPLIVLVARLAGYDLPVAPLATIIGALASATLIGWHRLRRSKPIRDTEILCQLGIDIAAMTGLLYFTGGWTNPLVSLYLVPIAAAVAMLSARLGWAVALSTVLCYAFIAAFYQPLVNRGDSLAGPFTLHVLGMWLTFVISAGLIAYFGTTMAATLRARASALARAREEILRNEQIIGVATLAAGTAHELSTPLGSIAVIAAELKTEAPQHRDEIDLLLTQIDVCKDILRRLREAADPGEGLRDHVQSIERFVDDVRDRFELLRPTVGVDFRVEPSAARRFVAAEATLRQAILNLLNNAADVSPHAVECAARCTTDQLILDIRDRGTGFFGSSAGDAPSNGRSIRLPNGASSNATSDGMGMGLLLANATIERLGGSVRVAEREGGGACVQVTLPLCASPT